MKPLPTLSKTLAAVLLGAGLLFSAPLHADNPPTVPAGYFTIKAAAGTGTVKKTSLISLPLYYTLEADGAMKGQLTHISASAFTNATAQWTPGQLSSAAAPCVLKITSGAATGRTFLISTAAPNTADTVTIDAKDVAQGALDTLGIAVGDSYELFPCDTLSSLFGTPETSGILGGASSSAADLVGITTNGTTESFFYSTTLNRWTKVFIGNPDASNQPLHPNSGITYGRQAATNLNLILTGRVSTNNRVVTIKNSGSTRFSQNWPIDIMLLDTKLHEAATWVASTTENTADKAQIYIDGTLTTYWFDGTHWREKYSLAISDNVIIPAGTAITLNKLGTTAGYSSFSQPIPYTLP